MAKERVVILGGGMAALTAAFELTSTPALRAQYDVTVYQLGWRLGGKGASGRNADAYQRIEEHGLHILLGFYENAFSVLRACYAELGRPVGAPLATWQDAFKGHDYVVLMEQLGDGTYAPWPMPFPPNDGVPGDGGALPTVWQFIEMILGWLKEVFGVSVSLPDAHADLDAASDAASKRDGNATQGLATRLHDWLHGIAAKVTAMTTDWRRAAITVDLGLAAVRGLIADGAADHGDLFALDTLDFRAWLAKHGASDAAVNSAYLSGMYDLGFSLPGQVGAGTALNGILRLCWTYKGHVMWKMQAGMGDTIFAPLYLVLKQRGVRFAFFHRVDALELSADHKRVARVRIGRQVALPAAGYDPLVDVNGLPCWPSEPRYTQLPDGPALKASGEDLEDWWTTWQDTGGPLVLSDGTDFDHVILGCSLGVFPYIAKDLIAASPALAKMVATVQTTQTQAAQLWMSRDLAQLGWTQDSPVLDGYAEPMDTWADMTHLVPREAWPANATPESIAYLCSPLPDDGPLPPRNQPGYAQRQNQRVHDNAVGWLDTASGGLWPRAWTAGSGFDWDCLVAPTSTATGRARFDTQYWIATMNPSDRYVLAVPGSVFARLDAAGAGFDNLYLAGDYLKTGMNVGCVEAATMGGMQASRAICGVPATIIGDPTAAAPRARPRGPAPPYISRGGDLVMLPPLALQGATTYWFTCVADPIALQAMVDAQLNAVAGAGTYTVLGPFLAIVCADITKSFSTTAPDFQKGWMAERDFGVWVPVMRGGTMLWYLPYVFVDNVAAMVTGREVFGFFKQTATLAMPASPQAGDPFTIDALVIQHYSPQSEAQIERLLTMSLIPGIGAGGPGTTTAGPGSWPSAAAAANALSNLVGATGVGGVSVLALLNAIGQQLTSGNIPMVFLKQFRGCTATADAAYQAVVEAPAHLDQWTNGWFAKPHMIDILACDSHPIASECGLPTAPFPSALAFWCQMDFTMMPGAVIAGG